MEAGRGSAVTARYPSDPFPPVLTQNAIWLHVPFALGCRGVEGLPVERGTRPPTRLCAPGAESRVGIRPASATPAPRLNDCWHLDEAVACGAGETVYLWRSVDREWPLLAWAAERFRALTVHSLARPALFAVEGDKRDQRAAPSRCVAPSSRCRR